MERSDISHLGSNWADIKPPIIDADLGRRCHSHWWLQAHDWSSYYLFFRLFECRLWQNRWAILRYCALLTKETIIDCGWLLACHCFTSKLDVARIFCVKIRRGGSRNKVFLPCLWRLHVCFKRRNQSNFGFGVRRSMTERCRGESGLKVAFLIIERRVIAWVWVEMAWFLHC